MESHTPLKIHQRRLSEEYWANDGIVPVFSQWHPLESPGVAHVSLLDHLVDSFPSSSTICRRYIPSGTENEYLEEPIKPEPGIWHVHQIENANHCSLAPRWFGTTRQKHFWETMGCWLGNIDESIFV